MPWSMSMKWKRNFGFSHRFIKYGKFWSVLPGHFIKHKRLISEEWEWKRFFFISSASFFLYAGATEQGSKGWGQVSSQIFRMNFFKNLIHTIMCAPLYQNCFRGPWYNIFWITYVTLYVVTAQSYIFLFVGTAGPRVKKRNFFSPPAIMEKYYANDS